MLYNYDILLYLEYLKDINKDINNNEFQIALNIALQNLNSSS